MKDIKAMLKSGILLTRNLNKILHQRILWYSKRLRDDDIIPIIEKREGEFHKI